MGGMGRRRIRLLSLRPVFLQRVTPSKTQSTPSAPSCQSSSSNSFGASAEETPAERRPKRKLSRLNRLATLQAAYLFFLVRFFFNLFYLVVALAQLVPLLQVGPLFTYLAPLGFVLFATVAKEAFDDFKRFVRDKELNEQQYERLTPRGFERISACNIKVGHLVKVEANQRVPADLVFVRTSEKGGSCFIRTDQLDGETDWKIRRAIHFTQQLPSLSSVSALDAQVHAEPPRQDIYEFVGKFVCFSPLKTGGRGSLRDGDGNSSEIKSLPLGAPSEAAEIEAFEEPPKSAAAEASSSQSPSTGAGEGDSVIDVGAGRCSRSHVESLSLENILWANSVVASGSVLGLTVYTGTETRSAMNGSPAGSKIGLFDLEVNLMSKVLFVLLCVLSFVLVALRGLEGIWYVSFMRFMLLLSSIIPISLQVCLIIAKTLHGLNIVRDAKMPGSVVRTSTIPEELGRISYLLTDKTGTLTQNEMVFKMLHIGKALFTDQSIAELRRVVAESSPPLPSPDSAAGARQEARGISQDENFQPLAASPVAKRGGGGRRSEVSVAAVEVLRAISLCHCVTPVKDGNKIAFQAASPDEVALVNFASSVGLRLVSRTEQEICIQAKRMGIVLREEATQRIFFYVKGAETVMASLVQPRGSQWLTEECGNFARRGLRTLVIAYKEVSPSQLEAFKTQYEAAKRQMQSRHKHMRAAVERLERDLFLLGLTGVEDKLQQGVPETLEALRHAGIRVWILTGDKVETATCIAVSAGLKARQHSFSILSSEQIQTPAQAQEALERFSMGPSESVLVVDGKALSLCTSLFPRLFMRAACLAPAVVCCRCSPTQKATVVRLLKKHTNARTCAVGDGGNDVSMIQAADVGIGLVGKEGRQASLAADFSMTEFRYLRRLLLWHGRNAYQRSAKLAHFVVHRGLIIAVVQVIFSAIFFFTPLAIFQGWLQVGYATYYTTAPVFSLVLDVELPERVVFMFPELYQTLRNGRVLSIKTFFCWLWKSIYQGAVLMLGAIALFENSFNNIVSITFTSLVLAELLNVASEIQTWHPLMVASEICTVVLYISSMFILRSYFDITFIMTHVFWAKVTAITLASWLPLHLFKILKKIVQPPQYSKLAAA